MSHGRVMLASELFGDVHKRSSQQGKGTESKFLREFVHLKLIGEGRYGCVFQAENVLDEYNYAVKRITLKGKTDTEVFHALREVRVMARFDHPGIVHYNSSWIEKPTLDDVKQLNDRESHLFKPTNKRHKIVDNTSFIYIQMQLCKCSLEDWLRDNQGERDLPQMKYWFMQIVSAVEYIHRQGIIHRDLKPSNILFVEDDRLKICDLGIATEQNGDNANKLDSEENCEMSRSQTPERTGNIGTPLYMSPEQISWEYGKEVDIFSLGLIFAEMCRVMAGKVRIDVFNDLKKGKVNAILHSLPSETIAFIQWLTNSESARRPSSTEIMHSLARQNIAERREERRSTKDQFEQLLRQNKKLKKISNRVTDVESTERTFIPAPMDSEGQHWLIPSLERYHESNPNAVVPATLIYEIRAELLEKEKKMTRELNEKRRMLAVLEKYCELTRKT